MKFVYSRRALADLDGISVYYAASASLVPPDGDTIDEAEQLQV
jgi:hypothetical protein